MQRVDQRRPPAGMVAAHPGQLHVGPDPGQQLGRGERLDEVVVGARVQALDRRLLAGPRGQQQHRHLGGARVGAQRGDQLEAVRRGIITSLMTRGPAGGPGRVQRGLPVGDRGHLVAGPQQPLQVLAHVGVVVGEQHAGRRGLARRGSARQRPAAAVADPADRRGSQRIASCTNGWRRRHAGGPPPAATFASGRCPWPNGSRTVKAVPLRPCSPR